MADGNKTKNSENLKESIPHGNLLFSLAVHLTERKIASDIMLYTHWHEELEILYILDGSMILQIDTQDVIVNKGNVVVITPNTIHGATRCSDSPCNYFAIVFHPSFIQSSLNDIVEQSYIEPYFTSCSKSFYYLNEKSKEHDKVLSRVRDIIDIYRLKSFGYELIIKAYILQILYYFIQSNPKEMEEYHRDDTLTTLRIKKILTFMEENYKQPFTLTEWAASINLSKEQFCRVFKKYFNNTPINYLLYYRISKAADLLIHSDMPIIDIALETGFESANYFTILFKNKTQTTPTQFRSSYGLKENGKSYVP
jgi:AraC-like DNA-binding protein/mannose-6-phosphate isomerase-like protein (cupin superfamily)